MAKETWGRIFMKGKRMRREEGKLIVCSGISEKKPMHFARGGRYLESKRNQIQGCDKAKGEMGGRKRPLIERDGHPGAWQR
jgi:hypothetical protein